MPLEQVGALLGCLQLHRFKPGSMALLNKVKSILIPQCLSIAAHCRCEAKHTNTKTKK